MTTNEVRDAIFRAAPEHADKILDRDAVVESYCREHGTTKDALSWDDVRAIRELPEWKQAGSQ